MPPKLHHSTILVIDLDTKDIPKRFLRFQMSNDFVTFFRFSSQERAILQEKSALYVPKMIEVDRKATLRGIPHLLVIDKTREGLRYHWAERKEDIILPEIVCKDISIDAIGIFQPLSTH